MEENEVEVWKCVLARAIGWQALELLDHQDYMVLAEQANQGLLALLGTIKGILDDAGADDLECYKRIDMIVDAFYKAGIPTSRHS